MGAYDVSVLNSDQGLHTTTNPPPGLNPLLHQALECRMQKLRELVRLSSRSEEMGRTQAA